LSGANSKGQGYKDTHRHLKPNSSLVELLLIGISNSMELPMKSDILFTILYRR